MKPRWGRARWLGLVIALVVAAVVVRSQLLPPSLGPSDARAGQLEGRVWQIDGDSRTIHISPRLFGIGAIPLVVSDDTIVIVRSKEGGFGDLREGLRVRTVWDRRGAALHARFVHVIDPAMPVDGPAPRAAPGPAGALTR